MTDVKITHEDTMKYRDRIYRMSTQEWLKYARMCRDHYGRLVSRATEYAFIVKCMKAGIKPKEK